MKNQIKPRFIAAVLTATLLIGAGSNAKASNFSLSDFDFNLYLGTTLLTTDILAAVWGTWDSGTSTFTPNQNIYADGGFGYADTTGPEINIMINRVDQTQYTAGTLLSLAIYNKPDLSNWDASAAKVVLTDTSWSAPAWSLVGNDKDVSFTANTTAVVGSFSRNNVTGFETITMVPEPSTGALMMIGAAGLVALRRLRKV